MAILRKIFWFIIFLAMTLCWTTILQHGGIKDFGKNLRAELDYFKSLGGAKPERAKDGEYVPK